MLASKQVSKSQDLQQKNDSKFQPWRGLFRVLDKLHIKKPLTRLFIFHPPKPSYTFEPQTNQESGSDPGWIFKAQSMQRIKGNPFLAIKAFKLYRQKEKKIYITPVIWIINQRSKSDYVMLYSHGNSADLGTAYSSALTFALVFNMSVIAYDYTGYGISPHKPSEKNLYKDIESVLSFAVAFLNYPLNKIILCGFSLGSGPTVEMAARYQSIPFMLLFAPLASCLAMVEGDNAPEKGSSHDMFNNLEKMSKVACDIIFIHGLIDRIIPCQHSAKMFKRYAETHSDTKNNVWMLEVEDADHHQLVQELQDPNNEYRRTLMQYFEFLLTSNHTKNGQLKEWLKLGSQRRYAGISGADCDDKEGEEQSNGKPEDDDCSIDFELSENKKEIEDVEIRENGEHKDMEIKEEKARKEKEKEREESKGKILEESLHASRKMSVEDAVLKEETAILRRIFSELTVNKQPSKHRAKTSQK